IGSTYSGVARSRNCEPDENLFLIKESAVANLGFIGLGTMGGNIAARLLESGHHVTGYNRTRAKAQWLVDRGMKWANSPRDVATAADVIFTMVTNAEALTSVAEGDSGLLAGLSSGKYCVDMSTVGPDISRRLASNVRERGADMIDAPVSGSVLTVQQGKLSIMVGGRQETFERLKPILQDIGPKVTYVGANGLALALKIAMNLDRKHNVPVPTTAVSNALLTAARGMGWEKSDFAIVFEVLAQMAGHGGESGCQS